MYYYENNNHRLECVSSVNLPYKLLNAYSQFSVIVARQ